MSKKTDIIDAARSLFSQFGLKKVTTDDIARISGISKATIYKYFKNKAEIFHKVVDIESDILLKRIKKAVGKANTTRDRFRIHLLTKMNTVHDLINFYHVTQDNSNPFWPYIEEARDNFLQSEKKMLIDILHKGVKAKELEVRNIDLTASIMLTSLKSQEYEWSIQEHNISLEEYIDVMIDIIMNGIRKR